MKEENKNVSKNSWKRIFGKKWFFPATYLVVAALLLTGVLWYQNLDNQVPEVSEDPDTELSNDSITGTDNDPIGFDQESEQVMEQQEVIQMPVREQIQTEIVTKFYDYGADSEDQVAALVQYNNKTYQSQGVDIASTDGETFDVTASLSGTVSEVKEDPLYGNVVKISHDDDLTTYYASLEDVLVEQGAEVKQGDTIASAGRNLIGQANGDHVHFELRKAGTSVDPEDYFNQPLSEVEVEAEQEQSTEEPSTQESSTTSEDGSEESGNTEENAGDEEESEDDDSAEDGASEDGETSNQMDSSAAQANA